MLRINYNGHQSGGEKVPTVADLIKIIDAHPLEDFSRFTDLGGRNGYLDMKLRSKSKGIWRVFGNFTDLAHAFSIDTDDPATLKALRSAFIRNWKRTKTNGWRTSSLTRNRL